MKFIKGGPTWRLIFGTRTFFSPLTLPPSRPRKMINQPLSNGLDGTTEEGACWTWWKLACGWATPAFVSGAHVKGNARGKPIFGSDCTTILNLATGKGGNVGLVRDGRGKGGGGVMVWGHGRLGRCHWG